MFISNRQDNINRFAGALGGIPNANVFRGSPRGGAYDVLLPKIQSTYQIGGRKRKSKRSMYGGSKTIESFFPLANKVYYTYN